jgi:hypothetical protein
MAQVAVVTTYCSINLSENQRKLECQKKSTVGSTV